MNHIGIDLAWTYKNESGVCVIDDTGRIVYLDSQVYSDEQLASIVLEHAAGGVAVAVDAPLVINNENGNRAAERELMSTKLYGINLSILPANRHYFQKAFGGIRGEVLSDCIRTRDSRFKVSPELNKNAHSLMEVFPTAICQGMLPEIAPVKYKASSRSRTLEEARGDMQRLLAFLHLYADSKFGVSNFSSYFPNDVKALPAKQYKHLEDKLDAFLCALCVYYGSRNCEAVRIFGNVQDGFILTVLCEKLVVSAAQGSPLNRTLKTGRKYRHFKGREYLVLSQARHSETLEELVVYQALYGECGIWVRPLRMFLEQVVHAGRLINRFEEVMD